MVRPLFEVRPVRWSAPVASLFDCLLLTSANAARLGGAGLAEYRRLRVFAVGDATADAAAMAGFADVVAGATDVATVTGLMANAGHKNVLYLAGRDRTTFAVPPFHLHVVTVYESETLPPPDIGEPAVAMLHSARAARRLAAILPRKSSVTIVAISQAVADAAGPGWQSVTVAVEPTDGAMLALAASLCKTQDD